MSFCRYLQRSASHLLRCTGPMMMMDGPSLASWRGYAELVNTLAYMRRQNVLDMINEQRDDLPEDKLFAVVHLMGRQHKVTTHDLVVVNTLHADLGSQIYLDKVLLAGSPDFTLIGRPLLSKEQVRVMATVIEHTRLKKLIVLKQRKRNHRNRKGHRQDVTVLRINSIELLEDIK